MVLGKVHGEKKNHAHGHVRGNSGRQDNYDASDGFPHQWEAEDIEGQRQQVIYSDSIVSHQRYHWNQSHRQLLRA